MAVLMVTGNAAVIPTTILEPLRTIPATIAAGWVKPGGWSTLSGVVPSWGCLFIIIDNQFECGGYFCQKIDESFVRKIIIWLKWINRLKSLHQQATGNVLRNTLHLASVSLAEFVRSAYSLYHSGFIIYKGVGVVNGNLLVAHWGRLPGYMACHSRNFLFDGGSALLPFR